MIVLTTWVIFLILLIPFTRSLYKKPNHKVNEVDIDIEREVKKQDL